MTQQTALDADEHNDNHDESHGAGHDSGHGGGGNDREAVVSVVAPNNADRDLEVDLHQRVDQVARKAVDLFVQTHQMEQMACSLALVVNGVATPLDDHARLEEVGVHEYSRLVLIPKQPKTDG